MKIPLLLPALLLGSIGLARAQQPTTNADTAAVERYIYHPKPNPMLTAADSARERARIENARQLRKKGSSNPAHAPNYSPPSQPAPQTQSPATPSPSVLSRDAQRRKEAARKAAETDKKREKTLYKRAKKSS